MPRPILPLTGLVTIILGLGLLLPFEHGRSQEAKKPVDPYPDFRKCTKEEQPFDVPPQPHGKDNSDKIDSARRGYWFSWYINEKTGELLHRRGEKANISIKIMPGGIEIGPGSKGPPD